MTTNIVILNLFQDLKTLIRDRVRLITVIDYGLGNLRSVVKALESVGAKVKVTSNSLDITKAKAIVLPGVGAFHRGIENLDKLEILPALCSAIREENKPFLGICLGLQLLFMESEEHGAHKGLNIIEGRVKRFSAAMKIPHMGWNQIKLKNKRSKIFDGIPDNSYFYFVHSYYVEPKDKNIVTTTTDYGIEFVSSIQKDNVYGLQFHPEKSSALGLKILENFVKNVE